jgi:hypothetical protein
MPRSKSVNTYPAALWKICERCAVGKEEFQLEVPSIQKALSLQGQFYAFRGALRREYDSVAARGKDEAWAEKLKAFVEFSSQTVCWVDRPGKTADLMRQFEGAVKVRFTHRDNTPTSELLDKLLETGRGPGQVVDDAERSLQEMLGKVDPDKVAVKP